MRPTATVRRLVIPVVALVAVACSSATAPTQRNVDARRETWAGERLADYQYDYQVGSGFFINFSGRWIHLVVRANAVVSATDVATGAAMPESLSAWPTIDQLFEQARAAAAEGALSGIRYDPQYGYPTEIDISGPPDASGAIYAKNLVPSR